MTVKLFQPIFGKQLLVLKMPILTLTATATTNTTAIATDGNCFVNISLHFQTVSAVRRHRLELFVRRLQMLCGDLLPFLHNENRQPFVNLIQRAALDHHVRPQAESLVSAIAVQPAAVGREDEFGSGELEIELVLTDRSEEAARCVGFVCLGDFERQ